MWRVEIFMGVRSSSFASYPIQTEAAPIIEEALVPKVMLNECDFIIGWANEPIGDNLHLALQTQQFFRKFFWATNLYDDSNEDRTNLVKYGLTS